MRPIKFRAKMTDAARLVSNADQVWICGNYFTTWSNGEVKHFIMCDHEKYWSYSREIMPETLGQFTGLTDNPGKEYYEGDLFEFDGHIAVVEYNFGGFGFYDSEGIWQWLYDVTRNYQYENKIIGNIHETGITSPEIKKQSIINS